MVRLSAQLHDARCGRGCDPGCSPRLAHSSSLTPNRLDCGEHQGRRHEPEISREVLKSIAADMEASLRALHPCGIQTQEKVKSGAGRCRIRGQFLLRSQLSGPNKPTGASAAKKHQTGVRSCLNWFICTYQVANVGI